jgi:hypothetical protein
MAIQIFPPVEIAGGGLNFELIASATPTSGGSVSFSAIDPKYKVLKLIGRCVWASTNDIPALRFNGSSTNYQFGTTEQTATAFAASSFGTSQIDIGIGARTRTSFVAYIFESNFATAKNVTGEFNAFVSGSQSLGKFNANWNDTTIINQVDIIKGLGSGATFTTGSSFYLLGSE